MGQKKMVLKDWRNATNMAEDIRSCAEASIVAKCEGEFDCEPLHFRVRDFKCIIQKRGT
jgi:hypothetical protein